MYLVQVVLQALIDSLKACGYFLKVIQTQSLGCGNFQSKRARVQSRGLFSRGRCGAALLGRRYCGCGQTVIKTPSKWQLHLLCVVVSCTTVWKYCFGARYFRVHFPLACRGNVTLPTIDELREGTCSLNTKQPCLLVNGICASNCPVPRRFSVCMQPKKSMHHPYNIHSAAQHA